MPEKFNQKYLENLGFKPNGEHPSVKGLFYKELPQGMELEVDSNTGSGDLWINETEEDKTYARLHLQFQKFEQLQQFITVITGVTVYPEGESNIKL